MCRSVVVARHTPGVRHILVFHRRLQHHAGRKLVDHAALDLLPRRLVLGIVEAAIALQRGTPRVCATSWYFTAGFSTMPSENWSTMERWISCHGVWCLG